MKLPLNCQLLIALFALLSWSVSSTGTLVVTQTPHVSVMVGDPVNITCCWTEMFEKVKVNWLKNQTKMKNEHINLPTIASKGSLQKDASTCSTLTFTNISREDSDIYFCKVRVEIPFLIVAKGNGTVITVLDRANITDENTHDNVKDNTADSSQSDKVLTYMLRCLPIIALLVTFFYLNYSGNKAQQHTSGVSSTGTLVVIQTPHVSVTEGDPVNIDCWWTETFERVRVNWLKNKIEIKNEHINLPTIISKGSLQKETRNCSTLTISSITREDSDTYICKVSVEVPFFIEAKGNGTVITVLDRQSTETLVVTQTPHVSVVEGEPVNIDCCWTGTLQRVRVHWLKNQTEIKNDHINLPTITSKGSLQKETHNCSTLTISNITREDSDTYICKVSVEVPFFIEAKGNGTVITVLDRESTGKNTKDNTADSTLVVTQTPHVSVVEGDPVNIDCCWTGTLQRVRVHWLKNQTEIKNDHINLPTITSKGSLQKETHNCSTLTISNITREDSDTYICKVSVEVQFFIEAKGNGTVITVLDRQSTDENTHDNAKDNTADSVSLTDSFVVTQTPHVSVTVGDPVNIDCWWTEKFERVVVHWLKNQREIKNEHINLATITLKGSLQKEARKCSTLTIPSITREDSDIYICKVSVEIPFFIEAKGNGTVITVLDRESKDENTHDNTSDSVYSTDTLVVTQTPHVSVMEGDPVNIDCCWTGTLQRMRVHWLKNQTEIKNEHIILATIISKGSLQKEARKCSTLTISNISREDSDIYICKVSVEIPFLIEAKGNGTVITVLDRESTGKNTNDNTADSSYQKNMLILVLRCLPILSLVLTLLYFNYILTKTKQLLLEEDRKTNQKGKR
ncbi:basement membrane-specific heparan sulfate proteoglycan core protein-like [Scomber scombrus]|uniref:Basement membrane-specific heparan sulfate proteoglycan core protein-like n=1 Tax=Scomber scombrus TaxID=13677 RepID=A0AAV1P3E6_SCOSC